MQIGLPEEASSDRPPWSPRFAAEPQLDLCRTRSKTQPFRDRKLQTKIGGRPDVRPTQRKEQIDFGAPPADASECEQLRQSGFIRRRRQPRKIETPLLHRRGKIARISHLLSAEPARTQGWVVERKEGGGYQRMTQPDESVVHLCRRIDRDLLLEDNVQQSTKPVAATTEARRPGAFQYSGEKRLSYEDRNAFSKTLRRVLRIGLAIAPRHLWDLPRRLLIHSDRPFAVRLLMA